MSTRILVPYDRSDQAQHALSYALGTFADGEIVLLHVVEPFADHTGAGGFDDARYRQQLETAEQMLSGVREWFDEPERERISPVVRYGRPVHEILRYVAEEHIDHIAIGSHGRDGAARLLLGSVAETVSRRSPVPVTVVREDADGFHHPDHVLVPFDASTHSRKALTHALTQFENATVTALYVTHPTAGRITDTTAVFDILERWDEEVDEHIQSVLEAAEEVATEHDRDILTESAKGRPAEAIVDYADTTETDHIVIGSTGRDGIARLFLGSVAETVIRRSPVSVTIAR